MFMFDCSAIAYCMFEETNQHFVCFNQMFVELWMTKRQKSPTQGIKGELHLKLFLKIRDDCNVTL